MSVRELPTIALKHLSRVGGDAQSPHHFAGSMLYGFRVGQIHGQFERLRRALRQVDELEELPILAPVIKLSAICDLASFLPPIANRRELRLRGRAALPKIEKDRLARLRPQARQRRPRAFR